MAFRDTPIQRKLMVISLLTTIVAVILMRSVFFAYEFLTFRQATLRQLSTVGELTARYSTAALAFDDHERGDEILSALSYEKHIVAAALYDKNGALFAKYPTNLPNAALPSANDLPGPQQKGRYQFHRGSLDGFQPVMQGNNHHGTLYLKLDTSTTVYEWLRGSIALAVVVVAAVFGVTYQASKILQKRISAPILALAESAKAVSDRNDYSVRAIKLGGDELGLLTDTFNQMLARIDEQNRKLRDSEARVRAVLDSALSAVVVMDSSGKIADWNKRAEEMFGFARGEVIGRELAAIIIPPHYLEAHRRGMKRFLATGEGPVLNRLLEMTALRRDGSEFPVELSISPLKNGGELTFCGFVTDITERKRVEETRAQFAAIVESSDDAIMSKRLDGTITSWNPGAEKLFGYPASEAVGQPMRMLFPRERAHEEKEILDRVARGETIDHLETVRVRKDGTRVSISATVSPIRDHAGKITGASQIARDITERIKAEEALRESQALYYSLVEQMPAGVFRKDAAGRYVFVNSWFCGLSETKPEQYLGKTPEETAREFASRRDTRLDPEKVTELAARGAQHHSRIMQTGERIEVEEEHVHTDGRKRYLHTMKAPVFGPNGKVVGSQGILIDITERKLAEEQLKASLKEISDLKTALDEHAIVAITDPSGKITYVNDKFCAISKFSREELIGQDHRIINSKHHPKEFIRGLWTTIARGKVWRGEIKNRAKDGTFYWVDTTIVPFLNDNGKPYQYVVIRADVTERKRVEEEIIKLNQELEQRVAKRTSQLEAANKELEAFSYSVSHDLRAPVRHIDGFVGLLDKVAGQSLSEKGRHYLDTIGKSAKQMGRLIDDLLVFSRMGRAEMRRSTVNLQQLVEECLASLQPEMQGRNIIWKKTPCPNVQGDSAMLRQVFMNLLSNAIKYSRPRDPALIEIGCADGAEGEIIVFIRDNGVGFDMEYANKLFGVFQRLHFDEDFEGTGIGLANVRRIIARHGGRTWAEGKVDAGATFYFSLPTNSNPSTS